MSTKPVRKAVIAAAGFGTRFLPQTKAMPKEMLPIVDKPIIQYIVEQLVEAGIEDIVIVTGYHKRSIEDHFDHLSADLRANLQQGHKLKQLEEVNRISTMANFAYIRQKGPYGGATPIMNSAHLIGYEPFIYTYADDIVVAEPNRFKQMIDLYNKYQASIFPCIKVKNDNDYDKYGFIAGEKVEEGVMKVTELVEKPGKEKAPSDIASIGGYLLTPDVFDYLEKGAKLLGEDAEFYITTYVLEPMIRDGKAVLGCELTNSHYYDTGDKLEYLKTVVDFALAHDSIGEEFKRYLKGLNI